MPRLAVPTSCTIAMTIVLLSGAALRTAWLRADPPIEPSVGIVWHDEGAWVHNARNRALWGHWRTDDWNPVFVAPVFTALEYGSFRLFGVGTVQARLVPVFSGLAAIVCLMAGLRVLYNRQAAVVGGALLAADYTFVMWNRAALMESTMTACMVAAWAAYACSDRRPSWGLAAGAAAAAAWFTKAAAAFFLGALVLDALLTMLFARTAAGRWTGRNDPAPRSAAAVCTLAGLVLAMATVAVLFVLPHWTEYRFYNWQMSVTRKPAYTWHAILDRASWLPVAQGLFERTWLVLAAGSAGLLAILTRWRTARPAERLLVWWVVVGLAELVAHDSGNERRYLMFVPALAGLAAAFFAGLPRPSGTAGAPRLDRWVAAPVVLLLGYVVAGSLLRAVFQQDADAGRYSTIVRAAAAASVLLTAAILVRWRRVVEALARPPRVAMLAVWLAAVLTIDGTEYARWARHHHEINYAASRAIGRVLPAGTLVQGKLANGLSLENRIRPLFVGNGFGNFADRFDRRDARYILTYDLPRIGYESSDGSGLISGILDHYPGWRIVTAVDVDETPGPDRAILIDKFPTAPPPDARH
jgi:4-amino-4-deoxy-L-arabinose transferase-like glycosyltransferase